MPRSQIEVETLLQKLETVLRDNSLWSLNMPGVEAMASTAPFACDTMQFGTWLQFIFIPRLRECMRFKQALPQKMGLYPMAQQCFITPLQRQEILPVLNQLDRLFAE